MSAANRLYALAAHLMPQGETEFDYIIVGGGTAGCVLANRLTEDRDVRVAVIEGGPNDQGENCVQNLRRWLELLASDLDYGYTTTEQPRGNSHILHSRARVLGGCSSHNTLISFFPFHWDLDVWRDHYGCTDWGASTLHPYGLRLKMNITPIAPQQRNSVVRDWISSCSEATGAPVLEDMNAHIMNRGGFESGVGFFNIAYDPYNGNRSSASTAYMHPIMPGGPSPRTNLKLFLDTWAYELEFDQQDATRCRGVKVVTKHGVHKTIRAKREVIICAGAFDTPRLLLLSGIGPKSDLDQVKIPVRVNLPGVGLNLCDHPETIIIWETRETPDETVMYSDAALFLRALPLEAEPHPHPGPDLMFHIYQIPFCVNTARLGYDVPKNAICMTPNAMRSHGRGKVSLVSNDPRQKPLINFKYFENPDKYDETLFVQGIKAARKIAEQASFKRHLVREVAPGPECQTDEQLSEYARKVAHTVYHPTGTCRMGTPPTQGTRPTEHNQDVVVDQKDLRVVGTRGLRVCDASVLPTIPSLNPMLTVLMVAERGADLIRNDAWVNGKRREYWD
ncbi:hypothetical protein MVES1_001768 [Malassezia vespertilionis]|uniref:Glucose-methanol-choline oxidoreductase N-terminal domain-containing protein n=1 Tax=Malassezia vespertilionis TaxID=2020962 RepID=A0A2N1JD05_9BASI|nr:uncharacterized protein MVES1_001768 [Malassezia vespertilionis]PKI84451.1 hypothetical protein MVES_001667 [Malassezia vespertilionis]WFD06423.1 hypothetical protein MVES1_001768 [Malassezia vespertilionis]